MPNQKHESDKYLAKKDFDDFNAYNDILLYYTPLTLSYIAFLKLGCIIMYLVLENQ